MSKTSITLIVLAVLAIVGLSYLAAVQSPRAGTGATVYETPDFLEGVNIGTTRQFRIARDGTINTSSSIVSTALSKFAQFIFSDSDASVPTVTGTSTATLTSAQVCTNPVIQVGFNTATGTITLPSASTLLAGACLTAQGDTRYFAVRNASTTGIYEFAAGASSSIMKLVTSSSTQTQTLLATTTIAQGDVAEIKGSVITSSTPWIIWRINVFR